MLNFSRGKYNSKLKSLDYKLGPLYTFSLLSGKNCPYAKSCKSQVSDNNGKLTIRDGPHTEFRCFSASQELVYRNVYNQRKNNWEQLYKTGPKNYYQLIYDSLPKDGNIFRIHIGGDYFNQTYFDSWLHIALDFPDKIFYSYTKSLPFWIKRIDSIPENFKLTASRGGTKDNLIKEYGLKEAVVVFSVEEAYQLGLEIDHDDNHALGEKSFALLIHNTQPKQTKASKALQKIKNASKTIS